MDSNRLSKVCMGILILLCTFSINVYSQIVSEKDLNGKIINALTLELDQKILLTDEQASQVKEILITCFAKITADPSKKTQLRENANSEIEVFLDKKQKAKFDILKKDWWD